MSLNLCYLITYFTLRKKKDGPEDLDESSQQSDIHVSLIEPATGKCLFISYFIT